MPFSPMKCPQCGADTIGTLETIPGIALLDEFGEYEGETKICWDGQVSEEDEDGNPILTCENGHQYAGSGDGDPCEAPETTSHMEG